ncbi:DUF3592 domain-containing protein [Halomonas saccharevitans]|uniref:DUF3592 domain-containing protein n=1 Tax=Halomonas saccharevitans TaxID=416872 RepID=A0ABU3NE99_9GAMM|nr:DUF3592 domain-containing protein [Halomonas saccharevitans]MDT8879362.1 DUF3592 domain-containing protein [Halomonas saccharevitans]
MLDIPLLIAVAALAGAVLSARGVWRRRGANRWPQVTATVTGSELEELGSPVQNRESPDQSRRYLARVHFAYRVDGHEIISDNGRFDGAPTFESREEAEAYLADYPPGRTLAIRHDPGRPSHALIGAAHLPTRRLGLTLFLLGVAAAALWLGWR